MKIKKVNMKKLHRKNKRDLLHRKLLRVFSLCFIILYMGCNTNGGLINLLPKRGNNNRNPHTGRIIHLHPQS